ncbi:type VI secretion system tube protein TssD [Tenacibaculum dicentrarchi]|uniref:type VI secretion system tube protein TssD n=1 Tax=Tenacibaculum dicentrarchi TaxID=669041 RepID=UPI0035150DE4
MTLAKLFILGQEIELLWTDMHYFREIRMNGKPCTDIISGLITLCFATGKDTDRILRWMTKENEDNTWNEADKMEDGKICFYENGLDYPPTKTYSFRDTHLIYFKEIFNAEGEEPMQTIITISPAIQNYGALMLKRWNESWVPPSEIMPYQAIENNEPNLLEYHIENLENKIIKEDLIKENQGIYLVIKSKNTKDIIADIDLKNHSIDYEYKGKWMKNDIIKGITLEESLTKVKLKAIKEKK